MQKKILYRIFLLFVVTCFVAFSFWPKQSQAECKTYDPDPVLVHSGVEGLKDKYFGADKFYLFVGSSHPRLGGALQQENVTKIAKEYLERRMLPCTEHDEVEVVERFYDKRLEEDNVLIAYIQILYRSGYPKSVNSYQGHGPNIAMTTAGYYRTAPYKKLQIFDSNTVPLSLERDDEDFDGTVKKFIEMMLAPKLKYSGTK